VVLPVLNYQFRFTADQFYATEGGMIQFFGYFWGVLNGTVLILLPFVNRISGRWGLPVVLLFHPVNYVLVFVAFLFRFDLFSAIYARLSTSVVRTTMNRPGRASVFGLLPDEYRSRFRYMLRGTVAKAGIILGSTLILVSERFLHPRFLSLAGIFFVGLWIAVTLYFKRAYLRILLDRITRDAFSTGPEAWKGVEPFLVKQARNQLVRLFITLGGRRGCGRGEDPSLPSNLDDLILSAVQDQDQETRRSLISVLSPECVRDNADLSRTAADSDLTASVVRAACRLEDEMTGSHLKGLLDRAARPEIRGYALAASLRREPRKYKPRIRSRLQGPDPAERRAAVIAAGESRDSAFQGDLRACLARESDPRILPHILHALAATGDGINDLLRPCLAHHDESVRLAALEHFHVTCDDDLQRMISLLNDPSNPVHETAKLKIYQNSGHNPEMLLKAMEDRSERVREGIRSLLEFMDIEDLHITNFVRSHLRRNYRYASYIRSMEKIPPSRERDLLMNHLEQRNRDRLENVLRVVAGRDPKGRMRMILRGLSGSDRRLQANSMEALDEVMDPELSEIVIPLLEDRPVASLPSEGTGFLRMDMDQKDEVSLYQEALLDHEDWVVAVLTLQLVRTRGLLGPIRETVRRLQDADEEAVRLAAEELLESKVQEGLFSRMLAIRASEVFRDLPVEHLTRLAFESEIMVCDPDQNITFDGKGEDRFCVLLQGKTLPFSVSDDRRAASEETHPPLEEGEGLENRSADPAPGLRALTTSQFLVVRRSRLERVGRINPQIMLCFCRTLQRRIRRLQTVIRD
jgi:hypothetical protein